MSGNNNNQLAKRSPPAPVFSPVFYIAARIHGVFLPLAVVSQIPTSSRAVVKMTMKCIEYKANYIRCIFSQSSCRLALRAELAAAADLYRGSNGPTRVLLTAVNDWAQELDRPLYLQSTLFPSTTATLLGSITSNKQWHNSRRLVASNYWSPLPLGAVFDKKDTNTLAVVLDVTDPEAVTFSMLLWRSQRFESATGQALTHGWCSLLAPHGLSSVSKDIIDMLWDLPDKPARKALAESGSADTQIGAMVQLPINPLTRWRISLIRRCDTHLVPKEDISCKKLAKTLNTSKHRNIETLRFTADTLVGSNAAGMDELLEVLYMMPSLESVYVADMRGPPTPTNLEQSRKGQFMFVQKATKRFGAAWPEEKIALSAAYLAQLEGRFYNFKPQM